MYCKLKLSSQIKCYSCECAAALHAASIVVRLPSHFGCGLCDSSNDELISGQMVAVSLFLFGGILFEVP